jgi:hypothetical protein
MGSGQICHYFVDEAGDPTLFDKKGKVIIGSEGCSRFFILGLLQVDDPDTLTAELTNLRKDLLDDPYFAGVPSMQADNKKTALAFHAKDDLPEIRREVLKILMKRSDLHFFGIIRDKERLLSYVQQRNSIDPDYHYEPNELYDFLVRRLFRDRLHKFDSYRVYFARRGSSDRTLALQLALRAAQDRFAEKNHLPILRAPLEVVPAYSKDIAALQAVDYFLWSLQRLYERGEDRYVSLLWPSFRLVIDLDDIRAARYGAYYDKKRPLNYLAIKDRRGDVDGSV